MKIHFGIGHDTKCGRTLITPNTTTDIDKVTCRTCKIALGLFSHPTKKKMKKQKRRPWFYEN